jgi:DNA (cytosine-5)-methyltransferase 1
MHTVEGPHNSRPTTGTGLPFIVSLFSGAGGLDWGFHKRGFKIALAVDKSEAAIRTHRKNFSNARSICVDLAEIGPHGICELLSQQLPDGTPIGVIGGPPCQGFSRANSDSKPDDPRNKLISLYLQIVAALRVRYNVEFVVFENVLGIKDKKHSAAYASLVNGLKSLNMLPDERELCALDFGVPQVRKRVIIAAMRKDKGYSNVEPKKRNGSSSLREAIGDLPEPAFFERSLSPDQIPTHPNHWTMRPRSVRFTKSPDLWRSGRSFRRTYWDKPSPTVAFGHREIHIHPNCKRRLSIYEAMLLQGFPATYVLEGNLSEQVEQVSNAVPPPVACSIASAVRRALEGR